MKIRDKLNDITGYTTILERQEKYIAEEYGDIKTYDKNSDKDKIKSTYETILKYSFDNLITKYSMGYDIKDLVLDYKNCIDLMQKAWKKSNGYVQMVWMLSIGIMLNIADEDFEKLTGLVENDYPEDFLIDFLIRFRSKGTQQSINFMFPRPYRATKEICELAQTSKEKALERLQKYLQKEWYRGHSDSGWYDAHKSKWNIHSGYWSFESGALVKILGLNDFSLKDQQYYPYDMVHWQD